MNPRNAAAGALKQLEPRIIAKRGSQFIPTGYGTVRDDSASELPGHRRSFSTCFAASDSPCMRARGGRFG